MGHVRRPMGHIDGPTIGRPKHRKGHLGRPIGHFGRQR